MSDELDDEERLRSVTLENARSIFLARRRAEEELLRAKDALWKQSESLRVTLASIGDAVVTTDTEARVLTLNPVAEQLTGWTQQEAEGRPLEEVFRIINERTGTPVESPAKRALETGRIVGLANHTLLVARHGAEIPIDDSAAPIRDAEGRVHGVVLVFRSVAERRKAEGSLRRSERELADFFDNASVGLHSAGPDGIILRVNEAELDLLGYSREEYVGHHIGEFHVDREVLTEILRRLAAGETIRGQEARMRCRDGSIRHVLIDASVLWEDGRFAHTRCFTRDITDRKHAQEVQARLAAIVESSQDAIIGKTLDSRIVSWNAGAEQLFGYSASEVLGRSVTLLIPPERQDEETAILERLRRGERIEHYDTVRLSKQGHRIDVSLTISPICDGAGRIVGASKIARDVTVRKRAEQRLALQYDLTLALAESAGLPEAAPRILAAICEHLGWQVGALWCVDAQQGVLRCLSVHHAAGFDSDRFETMSRERVFEKGMGLPGRVWASGKAVGIHDVVKDPNFHRAAAADADGLHGAFGFPITLRDEIFGVIEFFSQEVRHPDADLLQIMTIVGSQIGQFIDRKRAETARRRAAETTRFLADASAALATLADPEISLQKVAALSVPAFADWCAADVQEADGCVRRLAEVHMDATPPPLVRQLAPAHSPVEWEARATGHVIHMPIVSRNRVLGTFTFVSAESRPAYDADDTRAAQDLVHRAAIAIENANLMAALRDADRRKDEFLAMLAHELRNPLAPIENAVQILRARSPEVPDVQWAIEVIERQMHQMTRLVDDLLDVSRITRGRLELRKELVDLASIVSSAVEASRPLMEKYRHQLTVTIPSAPILLEADPARLAQVLSNLLSNSAKYTDPGGRVALTVDRVGDQVSIGIVDSGIGIPESALPRIFDLFMQADRSARSEDGLGIGLTLVKRLVEMHGGSVEARSDGSGKGSEFAVKLPVAAPESAATRSSGPSPRPEKLTVPTCRILVVDDNQDTAESLGILMRMQGHEVQIARDGLAAVEAAAAFRPHVVLLDLGLPKLSGYEAARRIRTHENGADVLLIALTGWGQEEDLRRSKEAGFDHHMTKPVEFKALQALLARWAAERSRDGRLGS